MNFKSIACPNASRGEDGGRKKVVVPNQSLSLQDILERFTREEALPIGRDIEYHESDDDLEKVQHMDLVDREEFIERLRDTQGRYEKQEKHKAKALRDKLVDEAKAEAKKEAEKAVKADLKP